MSSFSWGEAFILRGCGFGDLADHLFYSVLLAWVLSNSLLAAAITTTNSKVSDGGANNAVNGYMAFLLASVAGLACEFFSCPVIFFFTFLRLFLSLSSSVH